MLSVLKQRELASLTPFFKPERSIRLSHFDEARKGLDKNDLTLLKLWESMLTGRISPVNKSMREQYKELGLNHLFTPSGFHLSAVLSPLNRLIKNHRAHLLLLFLIGLSLCFVPGQGALKRMVRIKFFQKNMGQKFGFILALVLDVLWGSFQDGALSFTYSLLFLGIIYSGLRGLSLIVWFFLAQMMLAMFQGVAISPLLLLFSPVINLCFGLSMPVLFILAYPLWHWQLHSGLFILRFLHQLVDWSTPAIASFPLWEISIFTLVLAYLFVSKKFRIFSLGLLLLSSGLNPDFQNEPKLGTYEFVPQGELKKIVSKEIEDRLYFSDGTCTRKLVRGFWWEKCSPRRKSTGKKLKKLSYPS